MENMSQEQLQAAFGEYLGMTQRRKVTVTVLDTQPAPDKSVSDSSVKEWQSRIRYIGREGNTIEREVIFYMDEGTPRVLAVTEARSVA